MAPLSIRAAVESVDEEARTVDLVFSTGAAVERMDFWTGKRYIETLSLEAGHVRLDRLNSGGPLLDAHGAWSVSDQLGAVVPGSVTLVKKEARARAQFSRRASVEEIWQDVRDGLIRSVSVGYRVYKFEETEGKGNALPVRRAVDWEPFEISMVPIPADAGAKVRDGKSDEANSCEIVPPGYVARAVETREMPHDSNMPKVGDRVRVVRPHEPEHDGAEGTVRQAINGALGIEFDDMAGEIHQWYLPTEVVVTKAMPMADERSGSPPKTPVAGATTTKETKPMEDRSETIVEPTEVTPRPAAAQTRPADPPEPNERDAGAVAERTRVQGIRSACVAARLPRSFEDKLIAEGLSLVDAQSRVFDELRKREDPNPGVPAPGAGTHVTVGDDPLVHKRAGIMNALLHRANPVAFKLDDVGREYRGMTMMDVAETYLRARGIRLTGYSKIERAGLALTRAGMHTTSDFPSLLADVSNKLLRAAYAEAPQTWRPISRDIQVPDFKARKMLQVGDAPQLLEVLEHGEYTAGTITEAKEEVALKTYGRMFTITRQALINDDTNAFAEVPASFGRAARTKEADLAWAQITSNPTMGDGAVLFILATHNNLAAAAAAISIDSIGIGRAALRTMKGIDGVTPMNLTPRYLIVPAAKETIADQFVSNVLVAAEAGKVNPFAGRLQVISESRLDANSTTAWYLATAPEDCPVLFHATLEGQDGPSVDQELGFDVDGLKIRCRLDVAFKAADWHGIFKNAGA